ncbi:MAG: NAD(+) kinase, partial [Proteobacteria bacterium]|nr:NAD(+) kinase [Pseudomonadota bacterium]
MNLQFARVALVGKYHESPTDSAVVATRELMEKIGAFMQQQGCLVHLEERTAASTGLSHFPVLDIAGIGAGCDVCVVVGGDGTML